MNVEQALLNKIITTKATTVFATLSKDSFILPANKAIFGLIAEYLSEHNKIPNGDVLTNLIETKLPKKDSGVFKTYLNKILDTHTEVTIDELIALQQERLEIKATEQILEPLVDATEQRDSETIKNIVHNLSTKLNSEHKLPKPVSAIELKEENVAILESFIPTATANKIYLGGVTVISGDSGSGKSTFGLNQIAYSIQHGVKTALINMELSETETLTRLYACIHDIEFAPLYSNITEARPQINRWKESADYMKNFSLVSAGYTDIELLETVRAIALGGTKLIVIDYLGLVEISKSTEDWKGLAGLVKALHRLALQLGIVIVTFTQVNINEVSEKDNKIFLTPRGSKELIFSATLFWHIHITEEEADEDMARLFTIKARNAKKRTFILGTNFQNMRFEDTGVVL